MKKIQYISANRIPAIDGKMIETSTLSEPRSLDEFEITVIDLNGIGVWRGDTGYQNVIHCKKDLRNLSIMINTAKVTKVVLLYPQDCTFSYDPHSNRNKTEYWKNVRLKNMLDIVESIIDTNFGVSIHGLSYENTNTKIGEIELPASFCFSKPDYGLTESKLSKKITTIEYKDVILTTLSINTYESLVAFLRQIQLIVNKEEVPEWFLYINMFDDVHKKEILDKENELIRAAKRNIAEIQVVIDKNNEYKSILYTNEDELVMVVFDILQQILNCDLSNFVDEKKEDLNIKFEDITIIGEIKGVTSNVKSEHISQLDVHFQSYLDKLAEQEEEEEEQNVKAILIINHQRKKDLTTREPINKDQIELAKRNGSLIIETHTLLTIFEKYLDEEMDTKTIKNIFIKEKGVLEL